MSGATESPDERIKSPAPPFYLLISYLVAAFSPMLIIYLAEGYLLLGFVYAVYFVFWRVQRIDAGAEGAGWGFRLLLIPGSTVLWPYLMLKKFPSSNPHDTSA